MTELTDITALIDQYRREAIVPWQSLVTAREATIVELEARIAELTKPVEPSPTPGWNLEWEDNFTEIDTDVWTVDVSSSYGSGNKHEQVNTNRTQNVRIAKTGQALVVEARREDPPLKVAGNDPLLSTYPNGRPYSSGNIKSKKTFKFGKTPIRFEVRAKLPMGPGFLPCPLWLRPLSGDGEIDLVESTTKVNNVVNQTVHRSYTGTNRNSGKEIKMAVPFTEWHNYAVEVWEDHIQFFIDGQATHNVSSAQFSNYKELFGTDREWLMRISLAVGGTWVGSPTAATKFPAPMQVDWIRVSRWT